MQGIVINRMARLVGGDAQSYQVKLPTNTRDPGKMAMRCNNCPSRKCKNCPMFGVGEEFDEMERGRLIGEDLRDRLAEDL